MKRIFRYLLYLIVCLAIIFGVGAAVFWKKYMNIGPYMNMLRYLNPM